MIDEHGKTLWERVCATVNRIGGPRSPRSGVVAYEAAAPSTVDLHGYKLSEAWVHVRNLLADTPHRDITIITGQGQMARELPEWVNQCPRARSITTLNGGGAYRVRVRPK